MDRIQPVIYDFKTEQEIQNFILSCEDAFFAQVDEIADQILKSGKKFIALSGPTCSGKTTASERLCHAFLARGIRVKTISIDDFYIDREILLARAEAAGKPIDFDSPSTINLALLSDCVNKLRKGEAVDLPHYCFVEGKCISRTTFCPKDADYFLFEGIQILYPRVDEILRSDSYRCIRIEPLSAVEVGGVCYVPNELRLMRRLVRDFRFRSTSPEFTLMLWQSVRSNEDASIFPNVHRCNYSIDSTMPYDVGILKPFLEEILLRLSPDDGGYQTAQTILSELRGVQPLSSELIPEKSLYKEFI